MLISLDSRTLCPRTYSFWENDGKPLDCPEGDDIGRGKNLDATPTGQS